jgi:hypothetical protein
MPWKQGKDTEITLGNKMAAYVENFPDSLPRPVVISQRIFPLQTIKMLSHAGDELSFDSLMSRDEQTPFVSLHCCNNE